MSNQPNKTISGEDFMKALEKIGQQSQDTKSKEVKEEVEEEIIPQFLRPSRVDVLIDEESETYAVVKELTTLDFMAVKDILVKHDIENDINLNIFLTAKSWLGIKQKVNGVMVYKPFPPLKTLKDYTKRMDVKPQVYTKLQDATDNLNGNNEAQLKK